MKKLIFGSALLIILLCTFNSKNVWAVDYTIAVSYNNGQGTLSLTQAAIDNTTQYTVSNFYYLPYVSGSSPITVKYIKPFLYLSQRETYNNIYGYSFSLFLFAPPPLKSEYGGSAYTTSQDYYTGFNFQYLQSQVGASDFTFYDIPLFTDIFEAQKYSLGQPFDSSAVLGGMPFVEPDIGQEYYENHIYNFDKAFNVYRHSTTPISWMIAWTQPYDSQVDLYEDTGYHRIVGLTLKYPTRDSLASYMSTIWTEPQSIVTTMEYAYNLFTVEGMYDSRLTYNETTIWIDIDMLMQDSSMSEWWELDHSVDSQSYVFVMKESQNTFWTQIEHNTVLNSQGIMQVFRNYYSSAQQFCLALPYLQFVKAQMYTYNLSTNTVYNPDFIYWIDVTSPDGTVQERRNFGNPTNLTDSDLEQPTEDNINISDDFGVPNLSEDKLQSNYYKSISDSYNNVYNNYYYNNSSNQDILDYLNRYRDGGTQEEIQDAFGYVNSTVDSVSNVPLLLGKLFNGFFPPFVIKLFSALFIIFGVFIVIKIIRHLFL